MRRRQAATEATASAARERAPGSRHPAGDEGSATIWVLTASAGLVAVLLVIVLLASIQWTRQQADAAADLAALAAASALARGDDPCVTAGQVAAANGGRLLGCDIAGSSVEVTASAPLPAALLRWGATRVVASARAGLVSP